MEKILDQKSSQNDIPSKPNPSRKFYSDKFCYLRYTTQSGLIFGSLCLILWWVNGLSTTFLFQARLLLLIPVGIYVGIFSAVLIHNATHGSIKPKWLGRAIGEGCAALQLYGFLGWKKAHIIHHVYPDDPVNDPHAPLLLPYWEFARQMKDSLIRVTDKFYYEQFGQTDEIEKIVKQEAIIRTGVVILRIFFWYLLLGSEAFVFFYLPAYVAVVFFFIHFNYATHRPGDNGKTEVLNLNSCIYYKTMNYLFAGTYFHKNHHRKPNLFNPKD